MADPRIRGTSDRCLYCGLVRPAASIAGLVGAVTRRHPSSRLARSTAYRLGELLGAGPWTGQVVTGGSIALDLRDHGHRHIFFFGIIEPHVTRLVRQRFHAGWTMLDVGANAGYFSVLCSDLGAGRVIAFEPNPHLHALLEATVAAHPVIELEKVAVGSEAGTATLQISPDAGNTGLSTLGNKWSNPTTSEVAVVALDAYCHDHAIRPDLIKVDVEGHEEHVLAGMTDLLDRRVPQMVVCELTTGRSRPEKVIGRMLEAGYDGGEIMPDGALQALGEPTSRRDVCFVRRREPERPI